MSCHLSSLVSVPHFFIWIWLTNSTMDDCRRKILQPLNIRRKRDKNKFVWNSSVKFYLNWFEFEKSNLNGSFFWWNLFWRHFQEASLSHKLKSSKTPPLALELRLSSHSPLSTLHSPQHLKTKTFSSLSGELSLEVDHDHAQARSIFHPPLSTEYPTSSRHSTRSMVPTSIIPFTSKSSRCLPLCFH